MNEKTMVSLVRNYLNRCEYQNITPDSFNVEKTIAGTYVLSGMMKNSKPIYTIVFKTVITGITGLDEGMKLTGTLSRFLSSFRHELRVEIDHTLGKVTVR